MSLNTTNTLIKVCQIQNKSGLCHWFDFLGGSYFLSAFAFLGCLGGESLCLIDQDDIFSSRAFQLFEHITSPSNFKGGIGV
jgi:hypothetical protein